MAVASLTCVVPDGSGGVVAERQDVTWPIADGGTVTVAVVNSAGIAYDLTGCLLSLAVRNHSTDVIPAFSYRAAIGFPETGIATFQIYGADTGRLSAGSTYWFDVLLTPASGASLHIMPMSRWIPDATSTQYGEPPVSVPQPGDTTIDAAGHKIANLGAPTLATDAARLDTVTGFFLALPTYATNSAAVAGGLVAGNLYRTGGNPDLVCVVH